MVLHNSAQRKGLTSASTLSSFSEGSWPSHERVSPLLNNYNPPSSFQVSPVDTLGRKEKRYIHTIYQAEFKNPPADKMLSNIKLPIIYCLIKRHIIY